jgi:hypothetical protein
MARGLTDLPEEPTNDADINEETQQIIHDLIIGQNKLHDRLIDLERKLDHMVKANEANESGTSRHRKRPMGILGL